MQYQTKALYNALRLHFFDNRTLPCEKWQVEDLREKDSAELFQRLSKLGLSFNEEEFLSFAQTVDTPEDLTEILLDERAEIKIYDQIYLLVFELWRRFVPGKQSLSIFCDELDHRIFLYDKTELKSDESLQDALGNLEEILKKTTDEGMDPKEAFQSLSCYIAHDLETFIYDYISEQIEIGNHYYAQELLEGFFQYFSEILWFIFLKAKLLSFSDPSQESQLLSFLIQEIKVHPDLDLELEMLSFLAHSADKSFFLDLLKITKERLQTEEDFQELLQSAFHYYQRLDIEVMQKELYKILLKRKGKKLLGKIDLKDQDVQHFINLVGV